MLILSGVIAKKFCVFLPLTLDYASEVRTQSNLKNHGRIQKNWSSINWRVEKLLLLVRRITSTWIFLFVDSRIFHVHWKCSCVTKLPISGLQSRHFLCVLNSIRRSHAHTHPHPVIGAGKRSNFKWLLIRYRCSHYDTGHGNCKYLKSHITVQLTRKIYQ